MITFQEYQAAIQMLDRWFSADKNRTLDDIQPYTPEGDALHRIDTYEAQQGEEMQRTTAFFQVDTMERLEWYVAKVAEKESLKKRIQAQADAMIADVEREIAGLQWRFGDQAEAFLRTQLTGKKKSLKTLRGTIGLRKTPGRVSVGDAEALLASLPDTKNEFVVEKVDSTALNRFFKVVGNKAYRIDTGEEVAVPGLVIKPEGETLYVKSAGDE